jgi:hypothetical protein
MDHRSCYYREGSAEENVQKMLNWKNLNFLLEGESYAGDESAFWHFSASERIEYCRQCLSIFPATFLQRANLNLSPLYVVLASSVVHKQTFLPGNRTNSYALHVQSLTFPHAVTQRLYCARTRIRGIVLVHGTKQRVFSPPGRPPVLCQKKRSNPQQRAS